MRLLFTILLLSFPVIEIWGIFKLSHLYGWWFFLYMVLVTYLGWRLIKEEKQLVFAKLMGAMGQGGNPIRAMIGSARNLFAGILFIIPGVITDFFCCHIVTYSDERQYFSKCAFIRRRRN